MSRKRPGFDPCDLEPCVVGAMFANFAKLQCPILHEADDAVVLVGGALRPIDLDGHGPVHVAAVLEDVMQEVLPQYLLVNVAHARHEELLHVEVRGLKSLR